MPVDDINVYAKMHFTSSSTITSLLADKLSPPLSFTSSIPLATLPSASSVVGLVSSPILGGTSIYKTSVVIVFDSVYLHLFVP